MADKVRLSEDGSSIEFSKMKSVPTSVKKFRSSADIEGLYRFIYEHDLQAEAFEILKGIASERSAAKKK